MTSLNVNSFNTEKVTTMQGMLPHCSSLTRLNLSSFTFKSSINTDNMLGSCSSLTWLSVNYTAQFLNENACKNVGATTKCTLYTPYFCNLDDAGVWIRNPYKYEVVSDAGTVIPRSKPCQLWKHHAGEYCRFFDVNKPYWMTLIGNPEPLTDKIFTNLEFRACVEGDGNFIKEQKDGNEETVRFGEFYLPFDYLETWNEYQFGTAILQNKNGHDWFKHHLNDHTATLKRKFRIWRCDIPRDNRLQVRTGVFDYTFDNTFRGGLKTVHPLDRMRNPWLYLTLTKQAAEDVPLLDDNDQIMKDDDNVVVMRLVTLPKTEIHDLVMTYFN